MFEDVLLKIVETGILTHLPWISHLFIATGASINILLHKRDPKAATGWLGVVWLSPYLGAFFYWILGINRIKRKGALIHKSLLASNPDYHSYLQKYVSKTPDFHPELSECVARITQSPLLYASNIELFAGGDCAYESMLSDIERAERSIYLQTYIFDRGRVADRLIDALYRAMQRGVNVRVIVDAIGSRYSFPTVLSRLKRLGIPCRKFLPNTLPWHISFLNLRNHRKILLIDNELAYTGGMNIRDSHSRKFAKHGHYADDLHFKFTGPIVSQLFDVFSIDWTFASRQGLPVDPSSFVVPDTPGVRVPCRVISDGPDFDFEKIRWAMLAAIHSARRRIAICTPYFLPDFGVISALSVSAMQGVQVDILVPEKGNISLINWAMMPQFRHLIQSGCQIYLSSPPFDHSKSMVIDDCWSLIGSANWDPRSLRLNFEVNVEVYDRRFANRLLAVFDEKTQAAHLLTAEELQRRPMWVNLRDNAARLLGPYL
ncbi:MAG: cardiolipin synthase [Oligoflexus sp.]